MITIFFSWELASVIVKNLTYSTKHNKLTANFANNICCFCLSNQKLYSRYCKDNFQVDLRELQPFFFT